MNYQEFETLLKALQPLKCEPLKLEINDLSNDQETRRIPFFDENDIYIDYRDETLSQNKVIVPIYQDNRMLPLNLGSKFLIPKLINHGFGVYTIAVEYGVQFPNERDRRYPKPVGKIGKKEEWIYYDHDQNRYVYCNQKKFFKEKKQEVQGYKNEEWIMELTWYFYDFYEEFYLSEIFKLLNATTYHEIQLILERISEKLPILKLYFEMLNIFGDINDDELTFSNKKITQLDVAINQFLTFIHSKNRNNQNRYNSHEDSAYAKEEFGFKNADTLFSNFTESFRKAFEPEIINEIPNPGEVYQRIQLQNHP